MPKRKKPSVRSVDAAPEEIRGYGVILEEMRAQNRATIEAVETIRVTVEQRIDRFERDTQGRFTVLETAVRQNSADIRQNSADILKNSEDIRQNSADIRQNTADIRQNTADIRQNSRDIVTNSEDIRTLTARVEALGSLDRRVSDLERRAFPER